MATGSYVSVNGGIVTVNSSSSMCPAGRGRRVSNFLFQISNLLVIPTCMRLALMDNQPENLSIRILQILQNARACACSRYQAFPLHN